MANICPQAPMLNKGFWAKLEAWLRFMHSQEREFEVCEESPIIDHGAIMAVVNIFSVLSHDLIMLFYHFILSLFYSFFQDLVVITGPVYAPMQIQGEWFAANKVIGK